MASPSRASFSKSLTVIEIGRQWAGNKINPSSLGLLYNMQPHAVTDIGHLHIRPSVVLLIVLIQLLAAKPNKSIIIIIIIIKQ